jgi:hypothetical protein
MCVGSEIKVHKFLTLALWLKGSVTTVAKVLSTHWLGDYVRPSTDHNIAGNQIQILQMSNPNNYTEQTTTEQEQLRNKLKRRQDTKRSMVFPVICRWLQEKEAIISRKHNPKSV